MRQAYPDSQKKCSLKRQAVGCQARRKPKMKRDSRSGLFFFDNTTRKHHIKALVPGDETAVSYSPRPYLGCHLYGSLQASSPALTSFVSPRLPVFQVRLFGVGDERKDHPVQVVEEADEVEAEFDKADLLMLRQGAEDLCGVQGMVFVHDFVDVECDERSIE